MSSQAQRGGINIAMVHPDLGIGGAERLMIDLAIILTKLGHRVTIYTPFFDPKRCFAECNQNIFQIKVAGGSFPRSIQNRFFALCAYVRCILASFQVIIDYQNATRSLGGCQYDLVIADQVSVIIPIIKNAIPKSKFLFYGHFPDQLLAQNRDEGNLLKKFYRKVMDLWESSTINRADEILVNSNFTKSIFQQTFPKLCSRELQVVYPTVSLPLEAELIELNEQSAKHLSLNDQFRNINFQNKITYVSINRYERKKKHELAIQGFHKLYQLSSNKQNLIFVIAGGYDSRLLENVQYFQELYDMIQQLQLQDNVFLAKSISEQDKRSLLSICNALIYTPTNEHFGIVPIEAMSYKKAVVACASGGPLESVINGVTGFLCESNSESFSKAMSILQDRDIALQMGDKGREFVVKQFSHQSLESQMEQILFKVLQS